MAYAQINQHHLWGKYSNIHVIYEDASINDVARIIVCQ